MTDKIVSALGVVGVAALLFAHPAHAAPSWRGPPCDGFAVCSTERGDNADGDNLSCYASHSTNYVPNRVELALIEICQRAKAAAHAAPDEKVDALMKIVNAEFDLKDALEDHANPNLPEMVHENFDAIKAVAKDLIRLGERMTVYDGSDENWDDIGNLLDDIEINATVIAE